MFGSLPDISLYCMRPLPNYLIDEVTHTKDRVQDNFEIVAHRGVTVKEQTSSLLEHPMQLHKPWRHVDQVSHCIVFTQQCMHRRQRVGRPGGDTSTDGC